MTKRDLHQRLADAINRMMTPRAWNPCPGCLGQLTPTDIEAGYCTQCKRVLSAAERYFRAAAQRKSRKQSNS